MHVNDAFVQDFRETNAVYDIPGAQARKMAGYTSMGVSVDRLKPWPYARDFATDTLGLYDVPPLPRGLGASGSFETAGVETHLGLPGVNLHVKRRVMEAKNAPAPRPRAMPSMYDRYEEKGVIPLEEKSRAAPPRPRGRVVEQQEQQQQSRPAPSWAKPALDTPQATSVFDRSMSTDDILGAKPRRLVSVHERQRGVRTPPVGGSSLYFAHDWNAAHGGMKISY